MLLGGLSQDWLDNMAAQGFGAYGGLIQTVNYYAKATATASAVTYRPQMRFAPAQGYFLTRDPYAESDNIALIQTASISFVPTDFDEYVWVTGSRWRVRKVSGGPGHPFWVLPSYQVM